MIHQNFATFLTLLIAGVIATVVVNLIIRYKHLKGLDGFLAAWVLGYIGAWIGQPVLGAWGPNLFGVHWIPALIGAFAGAFGLTAWWKARTRSHRLAMQDESQRPFVQNRAA